MTIRDTFIFLIPGKKAKKRENRKKGIGNSHCSPNLICPNLFAQFFHTHQPTPLATSTGIIIAKKIPHADGPYFLPNLSSYPEQGCASETSSSFPPWQVVMGIRRNPVVSYHSSTLSSCAQIKEWSGGE